MRLQILLLLSFFSLALQAQPLKVETIQFTEKTTHFGFDQEIAVPYVVGSPSKVSKKINDYLYINLLGTLAPNKLSDGIKRNITKDDDPIAGITSMAFSVLRNDTQVLSLQFDNEFCGAYCEEYDKNDSFDVRTGRHLMLSDLLTDAGLKYLNEQFYEARKTHIKKEIKQLQQAVNLKNSSKKPNDETLDAKDSILLYESCLSEIAQFHKDRVAADDFREIEHFSIDAKGITFKIGRCSNHAMRALDTIDRFHKSYSFQSLKPYLTSYAQHLFLNNNASFEPPKELTGQVYYGSIGKAPITLMIDPDVRDKKVRAVYFYDKHRKPIALSGTLNAWTEEINHQATAKISAIWQAGVATGEWRGNKVLPFKLAP